MDDLNPPSPPRCPTPGDQEDYDVRRMHEGDFEKLAVYVVKDVHCERGTAHRADKTLPRSLTLKPSLVLSTPNAKVITFNRLFPLGLFSNTEVITQIYVLCPIRLKVFGAQVSYQEAPDLVLLRVLLRQTIQTIPCHGDTFGGYVHCYIKIFKYLHCKNLKASYAYYSVIMTFPTHYLATHCI